MPLFRILRGILGTFADVSINSLTLPKKRRFAVVLILTFALDWFIPVGGISLPEVAALSGIFVFLHYV